MNDPEAESKSAPPPLENRPAVTEREQKRNGCARGCLLFAITYFVLGGLFTWFIFANYDICGSNSAQGSFWLWLAMAFSFVYALTWPIAVVGVLIAFILRALAFLMSLLYSKLK
jgi:hypothetical protein